nr:hypothetical protein [Tanacetum cinerariifolium]
FLVNAARQNFPSQAALTRTVRKVNIARPIVNEIRQRNNVYKSHSPIRRPFNRTRTPKENFANRKVNTVGDKTVSAVGGNQETAVKTSAGCTWRSKRHYWNKDNPHQTLKGKGIVDSGCSRHMTRNKAYLVDYQDFNGVPVTFGGAARANSTNYVNTASTPVNATSTPLNTASTPTDQDDSQISSLEDIYEVSRDVIFTSASYDDEDTVANFTNLETTVNEKSTAAIWLEIVVMPLIVPAIKGFAAASAFLKPEHLKVDK